MSGLLCAVSLPPHPVQPPGHPAGSVCAVRLLLPARPVAPGPRSHPCLVWPGSPPGPPWSSGLPSWVPHGRFLHVALSKMRAVSVWEHPSRAPGHPWEGRVPRRASGGLRAAGAPVASKAASALVAFTQLRSGGIRLPYGSPVSCTIQRLWKTSTS